jgi:DNA gyrase subunit A
MDDINIDRIKLIDISKEMKESYINYSMSVITARALPDAKDGLKPVQRRIIYTMHEDNLHANNKFAKSARTVGAVMGKYHPHGDLSIYDALVHMAQYFSLRYTLIHGQGNFGSIDGDSPAAMRYTEAKLEKISDEFINDIDKDTVDFIDNYDGSLKQPAVLPSAIPNLLLNGTEGIAVGMATKIPPHNLEEVMNGFIHILDNIKNIGENNSVETEVHIEDLVKFIKGPDFPTYGTIYDKDEILNMYTTGRGRIVIRGKAEIVESKNERMQIIITELPFQINKARFITKIADLVKTDKLDGIQDLRDESAKGEIRVVIDLKSSAKPNILINKLFKYTELQSVFNANILALVDGVPKQLNLKNILEIFAQHRLDVVERRTKYELQKAKDREHILQGLKIAIDNIDEVIKIIRGSKDVEIAKKELMERFNLSDLQSQAILDMQLRRLAALEREKIENELKEVLAEIKKLEILLSDKFNIIKVIKDESLQIIEKYKDDRKTRVMASKVGEFELEDIIEDKETLITISKQGYIKRLSPDTYKVQNRGGKGIVGMTTKERDVISHALIASTLDNILLFSNKGRVFQTKAFEIPEYSRTAKGQPLVNLINLESSEFITSVLAQTDNKKGVIKEDIVGDDKEVQENTQSLLMGTKNGIVKKTKIDAFKNIRKNGLFAITLDNDDELRWVKPVTGKNEILLITKKAHSIRFKETDVRETGRTSRGVKAISINKKDDEAIGLDIVKDESFVITVSKKGFGKKTKISGFTTQGRGGKGVYGARVTDKTGELVSMKVVNNSSKEIIIISTKGQIIKLSMSAIPSHKRHTSGVKLINLDKESEVAAIEIS